jgi:hypothetical protein
MSIRSRLTALSAVVVVAFLGIAEVHSAQTEEVRLRGKVLSLNGSTLWVKTREGTDEAVVLKPGWKVHTGEGSYPWDLMPGSTMTNATVAHAVKDIDGRTLTLAFKGGEKTISVPEGIPIVTFAPATEADLKPGAAVFVPAQRGRVALSPLCSWWSGRTVSRRRCSRARPRARGPTSSRAAASGRRAIAEFATCAHCAAGIALPTEPDDRRPPTMLSPGHQPSLQLNFFLNSVNKSPTASVVTLCPIKTRAFTRAVSERIESWEGFPNRL